jgi:hypothetical protein
MFRDTVGSRNLAPLNHLQALEPSHDSRHYPNGSDAVDSRCKGVKIDCSKDRRMKSHQDDEYQLALAKRAIAAIVILCVLTVPASARTTTTRTDVLGAHVNSGRGCPACHTPHSIACPERNVLTPKANRVGEMLWGQDVTSTYAAYVTSSDQATQDSASDSARVLRCLTCHDGNYGPRAMMRNVIFETVPPRYAFLDKIPTLLDQESLITGHEIEDHPIGLEAQIRCGGTHGWDCTETNGVINMGGIHSSHFAASYGFFVKPSRHGNTSVVACTTCHNPHLMTITRVTASSASNLFPPGVYSTRHFLRAPYDPAGGVGLNSNRAAQFCRQCHADKSNEMNGSTAISNN